MTYLENPKTKGSGIICAIPQSSKCPNECEDCFFQSGRSYLEPLEENLPNMPSWKQCIGRVVRINDGNDSNVDRELVMNSTGDFKDWFFNTAIPEDLEGFVAPVVLTINPGKMTDNHWVMLDKIPKNLMFVRIRTNMWNLDMVYKATKYYTQRGVPVVITFMRYYTTPIPEKYKDWYIFKKHILNSYWSLVPSARIEIMQELKQRYKRVYECGDLLCKDCGNCIREYYATLERTRND